MPLLPTLPSPEPSLEDRQEATVADIRRLTSAFWLHTLSVYAEALDLVWNNSRGLTPQEAVNGLGSDAAGAFYFHGKLADFIRYVAAFEGIDPQLSLPTKDFEVNPDGSITILDTPYVPPNGNP